MVLVCHGPKPLIQRWVDRGSGVSDFCSASSVSRLDKHLCCMFRVTRTPAPAVVVAASTAAAAAAVAVMVDMAEVVAATEVAAATVSGLFGVCKLVYSRVPGVGRSQ
jgi:hypothetical protein